MRTKVLTTTLLIFGIILLLAWPFILGAKPGPNSNPLRKAEWGKRVLVYFAATTSVWLCTAMSAFFVIRRSRIDLEQQAAKNIRFLVEGTLQDHDRKS